jgi:hypothetical protein
MKPTKNLKKGVKVLFLDCTLNLLKIEKREKLCSLSIIF